ncbi:MAG: hypothetical protein NC095_07670 [Muribaculum sp.]|nr:hypothetical protein [Muribaculum sp.]
MEGYPAVRMVEHHKLPVVVGIPEHKVAPACVEAIAVGLRVVFLVVLGQGLYDGPVPVFPIDFIVKGLEVPQRMVFILLVFLVIVRGSQYGVSYDSSGI